MIIISLTIFILTSVNIIFVIVIAIVVSLSPMLLTFIILVFYHSALYFCIYRILFNFKHMTWPNNLQSWQ